MDIKEILQSEETYKRILADKLKSDKRLIISCPEFKYPEPAFVYVKCAKTEKSIAVRIDGEDKTVRFWDYVDDDYSDEDGVWSHLTESGIENIVKKLYAVMDRAIDIEYYDESGEADDYYSGIADFEINAENAMKAVKKHGKGLRFMLAKFSDFFGEKLYVFDGNFKLIKR